MLKRNIAPESRWKFMQKPCWTQRGTVSFGFRQRLHFLSTATSLHNTQYAHFSAQGGNKCIIWVICLSGWVMHTVYSWLYHSVSAPVSDRKNSTSRNEKKSAVQSNLIYLQETGCRHKQVAIILSQACRRLTPTKKERNGGKKNLWVSVSVLD